MLQKILIYSVLYVITGFILFSVVFMEPINGDQHTTLKLILAIFVSTLFTKYVKSFLFMVIAPWHAVQKKFRTLRYPPNRYNPLVSVIIPAHNEEVGLLNTVKSILASEYKNIEIIVVNDGSTDASDAILTKFAVKYAASHKSIVPGKNIMLRYFYKQNGGKGRALNFGLEKAKGDIIITIDADCVLTPQTMGNFVAPFADPTVYAAVGNVEVGNIKTSIGTIQFLEFLFSFYWKKAESVLGIIYIIGGAAGAFRREVFEQLGEYDDSTITEDIELSVRVQKAGMKIVYADDALVFTEGADTFNGLAKQRLRWKRGWFQTFSKHPGLFFSLKRDQNFFLSWIILPLTGFGNIQLFFELWCVLALYIYCYLTNDFSPFISWIVLESLPFFVQTEFEGKQKYRRTFFVLAPISWLLFYLSTYIEYRSLLLSLWAIIRKKELKWQKWERKGCLDETVAAV